MLQLYDVNHYKIAGLTRYKDFYIQREVNQLDILSFSYPVIYSNEIKEECYIRTKDNEYVIKEISNQDDDWKQFIAKVNIEGIQGNTVSHFETVEQSCNASTTLALAGSGWNVGSCDVTKLRTVRKNNCNSFDVLQEIQKAYNCEMTFDAINKEVNIYQSQGSDKGVYFAEQLNLKELQTQSNSYDYITRLIPLGKDSLDITSVNGGKNYVENYQYSNKVLTAYWEDNRYTVAQNLHDDAVERLAYLSIPYKSYKADILDLANVSEKYCILDYGLGDIIELLAKSKNTKEKQRIIKIIAYPEEPERNTCEIANKIASLDALNVRFSNTSDTVDTVTTSDGYLDGTKVDGVDWDKIQHIHVGTADIEDASITTAKIGDLSVTSAKIANAAIGTAQIADASITNAKIGNAAIGTVQIQAAAIGTAQIQNAAITQALIANSAVGSSQIANASIGTSHISELSADVFTSGTISTTRVTIAGANSRLLITGNRLQVFATKADNSLYERVSLGDVNGDGSVYGFRVRGSDGTTVLLDETGVKREGITDGSINNAKIGSDANISGTKLDINSVVTSINNGTTTIQGSKVLLNNKTLDVAFSNLNTTVSNQGQTISDHTGEISALQSSITLKVSSTDFSTYQTTVSNNFNTTNGNVTTAQNTANAKKRVFTAQPTTPYDIGDTWVSTNGTGDLMVCKTARASGSYTASDWVKSVKYTDDTAANNATTVANNAQTSANTANSGLATTNSNVSSLTTRMTTAESSISVLQNSITLKVSQTDIDNSISTIWNNMCPTNFDDWESGHYSMTDGTKQDCPTRVRVKSLIAINSNTVYYVNTFSGLSFVIRTYDTNKAFIRSAGVISNGSTFISADNEAYISITMYEGTSYDQFKADFKSGAIKPFICLNSATNKNFQEYRRLDNAVTRITSTESSITALQDSITLKVAKTDFTTYQTNVSNSFNATNGNVTTAQNTANTAVMNASNAQTAANTANSLLTDIANDNKLTAQEKQLIKKEWDGIVSEKTLNDTQATNFGITTEKTNYGTSYSALSAYITPLLSSLTTTSDITGTTLRANFKDYYDKRTTLLNAIATKAKTLADTANSGLGTTNGNVTSLTTRVTSAESSITALQSSITLKVSQTDINNSINAIQIGVRNLVRNGRAYLGTQYWSGVTSIVGGSTFALGNSTTSENYLSSQEIAVQPNTTYTIQFMVALDASTPYTSYDCFFMGRKSTQAVGSWTYAHSVKSTGTNTAMTRYTYTFTTNSDEVAGYIRFDNNGSTTSGTSTYLYVTNVKMEAGTKATDYTDAPEDIQASIYTAQTTANTANSSIADMANDNLLTPVEKSLLKKDFDAIVAEKPNIDAQATTYNITTELTNYDTSYTTLYNYTNPLFTSMTTNSSIVGTTLRSYFSDYYNKKVLLLKKISDLANSSINTINNTTIPNAITSANNNAQSYASTAQANAISTASSDATNKANNAQTTAVQLANNVNKWLCKRYNISGKGTATIDYTTIQGYNAVQTALTGDEVFGSLVTSNIMFGANYDNYVGYATTNVYVATTTNLAVTLWTDDNGCIYVNGVRILGTNSSVTTSVTLPLVAGWNKIEVIWADGSGPDGFYFPSGRLSQNAAITNMQCAIDTVSDGRVSAAESNIGGLTTRVSTAELKITDDAFKFQIQKNLNNVYKVRYIRDWIQGSNVNTNNTWRAIEAVTNTGTNVALNKTVTSNNTLTNGSYAVDGNYSTSASGVAGALQYVQVDLGQIYDNINAIKISHNVSYSSTLYYFNNTKTEVSADGVTWYQLFNNAVGYLESDYPRVMILNTNSVSATQVTIDDTGLTVKNGAIKIQNVAGTNVLVADALGNLTINGIFQQYNTNTGVKSVEIQNNMYKMYDWILNNDFIGALCATNNGVHNYAHMSLFGDSGNPLSLGIGSNPDLNQKANVDEYIVLADNGDYYTHINFYKDAGFYNYASLRFTGNGNDVPNGIFEHDGSNNFVIASNRSLNNQIHIGNHDFSNGTIYTVLQVDQGGCTIYGNLQVNGSKNRIVKTDHYGTRALNSYETADCLFADIGNSTVKDGICRIDLDIVFLETVSTDKGYNVFLTKYAPGDIWVDEMQPGYFVVKGDNIPFAWEVKAKQKGYENNRLELISA